jgi:hypothetical protein
MAMLTTKSVRTRNIEKLRASVLESFGAHKDVKDELLRYNKNIFSLTKAAKLTNLQLPPEMHLPVWERYAQEAKQRGVFNVLKTKLMQFRFPIKAGISKTVVYKSATRRGIKPNRNDSAGLLLNAPEKLTLCVYPTPVGKIPLIIAPNRVDFVALVCALTLKNEPESIPSSMGACIVCGYANWDRIHQYWHKWMVNNPFVHTATAWKEEFKRLKPQKHLYQDTFIILSRESYSNVSASDLNLSATKWRELSLIIRREHECTHYFTHRVLQSMRNNLFDELIADYFGIVAALGYFRADWALHFFGLEDFPKYRCGGRLENYQGDPPLSRQAFGILQKLVNASCENLEIFSRNQMHEDRSPVTTARTIMALAQLSLEELAASERNIHWKIR